MAVRDLKVDSRAVGSMWGAREETIFFLLPLAQSKSGIERAADAEAGFVEDVGVDLGGVEVGVAEEFLDGAEIVVVFGEVGREAVAEGVGGGGLGEDGVIQAISWSFSPGGRRSCAYERMIFNALNNGMAKWSDATWNWNGFRNLAEACSVRVLGL